MKKPKHVFQFWIRTTPDRLWDAITNPTITKQYFFGTEVRSDFKVGSGIAYHEDSGQVAVTGQVVEADPPRKLVTTFRGLHDPAAKDDPPSRVTWEIEQNGEMCKVTLIHDGFESETRTFESVHTGWPYILSGLKSYLETGKALPDM